MPLYDLKCQQCDYRTFNVLLTVKELRAKTTRCPQCKGEMQLIPPKVHSKVGISVDGKDRGKIVKEKNEQLKRRNAGYSHETKALRRDIERQVKKKVQGS